MLKNGKEPVLASPGQSEQPTLLTMPAVSRTLILPDLAWPQADPGPLDPRPAFPKMMPSLELQLLTESDGSQGRVSGPRVSLQPGYGSRLGYAAAQWSFPQAPELTASQKAHHPLTHVPASLLPVPSICPASPPLPGPETGKPLSPFSLHCTHSGEGPSLSASSSSLFSMSPPHPGMPHPARTARGPPTDVPASNWTLLTQAPIITHQFNKQAS